jgi:hypothetical protein
MKKLILMVIAMVFITVGAGTTSAQTPIIKWHVWGNEQRALQLCGPLPNIDLSTVTSFYHPVGTSSVKSSVTKTLTVPSLACQWTNPRYEWTPEPIGAKYGVGSAGQPVSFEGVEKDESYKACHNDTPAVFIQTKEMPPPPPAPVATPTPTPVPPPAPTCANIPTLPLSAAPSAGLIITADGRCVAPVAQAVPTPDCPTCPKSSYRLTEREGVWDTKQALGSAVGGIPSGIASSGNLKRKVLTGAAVGVAGIGVNVLTKAVFKETQSDKAYEFRFEYPGQEPEIFELKVGESRGFTGGQVVWASDHWNIDIPGCGTSFVSPHTGFALTPIVYIKRTGQVAQVNLPIPPAKTTPTTGTPTPVRPGNPDGPSAGDLPNGGQLPGGPAPGPIGGVPTRPRRPNTGSGWDTNTVLNQVMGGSPANAAGSPGSNQLFNLGGGVNRSNTAGSPGRN